MGKKKSAVLIVLMSVVLAALLFISVTPSFYVNTTQRFTSLLSIVDLGSDLGGGYSVVYYPEGVITKEEYESLEAAYEEALATETTEDDMTDPATEYVAYKGIYIGQDHLGEDNAVTESFVAEFDSAVRAIEARYEAKGFSDYSVDVQDDYTIVVTVPDVSNQESISDMFAQLAYSASLVFTDQTDPNTTSSNRMLGTSEYVRGATVVDMGTSTGYGVGIELTAEGRARFAEITGSLAGSSDSSGSSSSSGGTLYIYVGDNQLMAATVSSQLDQDVVYVSGNFETREEAETIACVINTTLDENTVFDLQLDSSRIYSVAPTMGDNAALIAAVVFGVLSLAMIVYSLIRYKGMGLAHMFGYLAYALGMILCISLIGAVRINIAGLLAIAVSAAIMCGFNAYAFSNIRSEFATGKTLTAAIKAGYKKSLALTIDAHIVLFVAALVLFLISTGTVYYMALVFMLGTALSAAVTLGVTRFCLYVFLAQPKNKIAFCNLKREETEDE